MPTIDPDSTGISETSPFIEDFDDAARTAQLFIRDNRGTIDPSFPKQGVLRPSHLGSQSLSPEKEGIGDYEEDLPAGSPLARPKPAKRYDPYEH